MEETSEARNNNINVANEYPEELREEGEVALLLITLKYSKLDNRTANDLSMMKNESFGEIGVDPDGQNQPQNQPESLDGELGTDGDEHNVDGYLPIDAKFENDLKVYKTLELKLPHVGWGIDGLNLPEFPPIKKLESLIGRCSAPFEKQLTNSDVNDTQSRMSIPKEIIQDLKKLMNPDEDLDKGIPVTVYNSKGDEYSMIFKLWTLKLHVLTAGWKSFRNANSLVAHQDWVTVWMFRHNQTQKLCFVVTARRFSTDKLITKRIKKDDFQYVMPSRNTAKKTKRTPQKEENTSGASR